MPSIAFLIARTDTVVDDNYRRFANELLNQQYEVHIGFMDSLAMAQSHVTADLCRVTAPLAVGAPFAPMAREALARLDVVWVLSLGWRASFLDKVQLLHALAGECRLINSVNSLMHLKSKYFLASHPEVFQHPAVFASTNPAALFQHMQNPALSPGGRWIVKPPAGSMGRSVFLLSADDTNAQVILETLTGPDQDQYCLLQPYVAEIEAGEKRVLLAGGQPVGQYLRLASKDHRTNHNQGAQLSACDLSTDEHAYCKRIGAFLLSQGAEFVGLDLAYPWVIEFNVVNPGGLITLETLTGNDPSKAILAAILTGRQENNQDDK